MKLMKKCVDEIFLCGFHYFLCDFRIKSSVAVRFFTESSDIDLKRKSRIVFYQINQKRKRSVTDEIIKDQMPSIISFLNDANSSRKSSNVSNFN
jgi:hypothetical protein